ncbi:hypothetical protein FA743_10170 [Paracoccus gahaiensis]|uniref:Uncharacterized protein n=1 Tax=Paracoccus gahaiensis TaxID=1706839 RepID=A0A4U0RAE3_9RHOB|nr:hypothetical protein [Paracoccus gahaiensis]TJZ91826.1 hypothetical protein FA743_10170 [Paracoccus gahaiensis]
MSLHQTIRTPRPLCAITLIDRRMGCPHRVNGAALTAASRGPALAALDLPAGGSARIQDSGIRPLPGTPLI